MNTGQNSTARSCTASTAGASSTTGTTWNQSEYRCLTCGQWTNHGTFHVCPAISTGFTWITPMNRDAEVLEELRAIRHLLEFALKQRASEV